MIKNTNQDGFAPIAFILIVAGLSFFLLTNSSSFNLDKITSSLLPKDEELSQEEKEMIEEETEKPKTGSGIGNFLKSLQENFSPTITVPQPSSTDSSEKAPEEEIATYTSEYLKNQSASQVCPNGKLYCSGNAVYYCFDSGEIQLDKICETGCTSGECN